MTKYWKISCGRGGRLAPIHRDLGLITIDFNLGCDLKQFASFELWTTYLKGTQIKARGVEAAGQCWTFSHDIREGDTVFGYGAKTIFLMGLVAGQYQYRKLEVPSKKLLDDVGLNFSVAQHCLPMKWTNSGALKTEVLGRELRSKLTQLKAIVELTQSEGTEIIDAAKRLNVL